MALLETDAPFTLAATNDVDVKADLEHSVRRHLEQLLAKRGLHLDPLGHEIWMPGETRYERTFSGSYVALSIADTEAILLSKAKMAPAKNRPLLIEYLAAGPSQRFVQLARKYDVDLEALL